MALVDILHLDDCLIVVNKPAGIAVLPDGWELDAPYLVQLLTAEFGRVWIVHRLDKVTSGVIIFARSSEAHRSLSVQFERHEVRKVYHAIGNGLPEWSTQLATQSLRSNVGHRHRTVVDTRAGKHSLTAFRVLKRFRAHVLLEAVPRTGRTHQVRAHAAALHCPLLGDSQYGSPPTDLIARPALHALSLGLMHPSSGESITFTAPYADDFRAALQSLGELRLHDR